MPRVLLVNAVYDQAATRKAVLAVLPKSKRRTSRWSGPQAFDRVLQPAWSRGRYRVLASVEVKTDGHRWLHVSVSLAGARKLPDYAVLGEIRECFFPADRHVIHVWPPHEEHVSDHEVLHLWARIEGPALIPDLRVTDLDGRAGV